MTSYTAQPARQREYSTRDKHWMSSTSVRLLVLFIFVIGSLLYVLQTSAVSTTGYEITAMQKQIQSLKQENQRVQFDIATHRSMKSIQARLSGLRMVAADEVEYINVPGGAVARR